MYFYSIQMFRKLKMFIVGFALKNLLSPEEVTVLMEKDLWRWTSGDLDLEIGARKPGKYSNFEPLIGIVIALLGAAVWAIIISQPKEVTVRVKRNPSSWTCFYSNHLDMFIREPLPNRYSKLGPLVVVLISILLAAIWSIILNHKEFAIKNLEDKIKSYEMRYSRVKQDYINVSDSLASEIKNRTALLSSKRKLETDISNMRRELHTHKTEFDFNEHKIKIQDLEVANKILQNENGRLRQHLQDKDITIQNLEQVLKAKNQKEERINQDLAEKTSKLQSQQHQGDDMKCLIDRLQASLRTKEAECTTLHHLLEDRRTQIEGMVVQEQILRDTLKNVEADGNNKDRLLRELSIKHEQLLHSFNDLKCHLGGKTEELLIANKERNTLSEQVMLLKEEVQRLLQETKKLNRELENQVEDNNSLKLKIQNAEYDKEENELFIERLQKQLHLFVTKRDNIHKEILALDDDIETVKFDR